MFEITSLSASLESLQWFAAVVFIPLVCWQHALNSSVFCRWCALLSGYGVQIGFFMLLDDAGFQVNVLILISSIAAYFWITTTTGAWPDPKIKPSKNACVDAIAPVAPQS